MQYFYNVSDCLQSVANWHDFTFFTQCFHSQNISNFINNNGSNTVSYTTKTRNFEFNFSKFSQHWGEVSSPQTPPPSQTLSYPNAYIFVSAAKPERASLFTKPLCPA